MDDRHRSDNPTAASEKQMVNLSGKAKDGFTVIYIGTCIQESEAREAKG